MTFTLCLWQKTANMFIIWIHTHLINLIQLWCQTPVKSPCCFHTSALFPLVLLSVSEPLGSLGILCFSEEKEETTHSFTTSFSHSLCSLPPLLHPLPPLLPSTLLFLCAEEQLLPVSQAQQEVRSWWKWSREEGREGECAHEEKKRSVNERK